MKLAAILLLCVLVLVVPPSAEASGVHKCYGNATAGACLDYEAVNDFCASANYLGKTHEECVLFIGPPI